MLESIRWNGPVVLNGKEYSSIDQAVLALKGFKGDVCMCLKTQSKPGEDVREQVSQREIRIHVRQYMTKPPTPSFDFHDRWNEGKAMPLRTMQGKILEETRGMVKMELHGVPMQTDVCMKCGRPLTHPVSVKYGIGPECGGHWYIDPEGETVEQIKKKIESITWTGWVIKSAILEEEDIEIS